MIALPDFELSTSRPSTFDHFAKMFKMGWPISVQMGGEMLSFL